jgi:hypothetical protein
LVIQNETDAETDRVLKAGKDIFRVSLKPNSFNTIVLK